MRKIVFLSLVMGLCFVGTSFAKGKCKLAPDCSGGGQRGQGYNVLRTDGERAYSFDSGQCYRCNWGPNEFECPESTVVAIVHKDYYRTGEIKSLFTCSDRGTANDDWLPTNPTGTCDPTKVDVKQFAEKMGRDYVIVSGVDHTTRHYLLGGGSKTGAVKDDTGDNVVLSSGQDACVAYLCEEGYKADEEHKKCIKEGGVVNPNPPAPSDCDRGGYEIATQDIILTAICPECSRIVKGQCYASEMLRCYEAIKRGEPANWNGEKCNCGDKQKWDTKSKKCQAPAGQSCAELYKGFPERIACCDAGRYTIWMGTKENGTCICVNPSTKVQDPALEWIYDAVTKRGYCKAKDGTVPPVIPPVQPEPEEECWYKFYGEFKCSNGTRVKKAYDIKLTKEDLKGLKCGDFQKRYYNDARGIESLFQKLCRDSQYTEPVPLDAATKKAINNINSFFDMSEANRNVWRDEEGQFNTARLASDATAGVVLGTVGGIVSAKVIKKKQLEKGFDVLHCTVGGQKMADYGDTFQVSYQR